MGERKTFEMSWKTILTFKYLCEYRPNFAATNAIYFHWQIRCTVGLWCHQKSGGLILRLGVAFTWSLAL